MMLCHDGTAYTDPTHSSYSLIWVDLIQHHGYLSNIIHLQYHTLHRPGG